MFTAIVGILNLGMLTGFKTKVLLEFKEVFDEEPLSFETYLDGISREKMLMIGAHFLGFNNRKSQFDGNKEFLGMYFSEENSEIGNKIYSKINELEKDGNEVVIVNSLTSLQLFEYCFENLGDKNTKNNRELEVDVFKAYTLLTQMNTEKDQVAFSSTSDLKEKRFEALVLAQSFPYSDVLNYNLIESFICEMVKSIYLLEFLKSNKETKKIYEAFLRRFECQTHEEYLKRLIPLGVSIISNEKEGYLDIEIPKDDNFKQNCEFINKLTVLDNEQITDIDFRNIRTKPLYRVEEGRYRVIFGLFVIEKIFKGLYFILRDINSSLPKDKRIKDFRGFYCDYFSEKTLLYEILKQTYRKKYIQFTGSEMKQSGFDAEPDYYIRNGNYLYLFESKDTLIAVDKKKSRDYNQIKAAFKEKFYFEEKDGKISNKAVLQLINNIRKTLAMKLPFDKQYKAGSIKIYPILIIHDAQYNLVGLNNLVNNWFKEELVKIEKQGFDTSNVKNITIIDIDTLIIFMDFFKQNTLSLNRIIDQYHNFIKLNTKKTYRSQEEVNEQVKKTVIPFSNFLNNYAHDKRMSRMPSILIDKGFTLFK